MKLLSVLTFVLGLFVASVALTGIALLCSLCNPTEIDFNRLLAGELWPLWTGTWLWSQYPSTPPLSAMIDYYAILVAVAMITPIVYLVRLRLKMSLGVTGLAVLSAGMVPYALGKIAFRAGPLEPNECGAWLAVMLVGVSYFSAVAAVLAGLEVTGVHERIARRLVGFRWRMPARRLLPR